MSGGDDGTTMWIYLMPLNCTFKHGLYWVHFTTIMKKMSESGWLFLRISFHLELGQMPQGLDCGSPHQRGVIVQQLTDFLAVSGEGLPHWSGRAGGYRCPQHLLLSFSHRNTEGQAWLLTEEHSIQAESRKADDGHPLCHHWEGKLGRYGTRWP